MGVAGMVERLGAYTVRAIHRQWLCGVDVLGDAGFGEHYLVDLIVAVPFVLLIEAICALRRRRGAALGAIVVGLGLTLGWLLILRTPLVAQLPAWAAGRWWWRQSQLLFQRTSTCAGSFWTNPQLAIGIASTGAAKEMPVPSLS